MPFPTRIVDQPRPGYFRKRLVPKGPLVAAKIEFVEGQGWLVTVNGERKLPWTAEPNAEVLAVWHSAVEIDEDDYNLMIAYKKWAEQHDPEQPAANPRKEINVHLLKPPAF